MANKWSFRQDTRHLKNNTDPSFCCEWLDSSSKSSPNGCKRWPLVNLCEHYVFGGWYQCGPMQYYEWCVPVSNPIYISSSIIYGLTDKSQINLARQTPQSKGRRGLVTMGTASNCKKHHGQPHKLHVHSYTSTASNMLFSKTSSQTVLSWFWGTRTTSVHMVTRPLFPAFLPEEWGTRVWCIRLVADPISACTSSAGVCFFIRLFNKGPRDKTRNSLNSECSNTRLNWCIHQLTFCSLTSGNEMIITDGKRIWVRL